MFICNTLTATRYLRHIYFFVTILQPLRGKNHLQSNYLQCNTLIAITDVYEYNISIIFKSLHDGLISLFTHDPS